MKLIAMRPVRLDSTDYKPGDSVPWFASAGLCVEQGLLRLDGGPTLPPAGARVLVESVGAAGFAEAGQDEARPQQARKRGR